MDSLRTLVLYVFALNATASALVAWDDRVAGAPLRLLLWALALGGALVLGSRLEPGFADIDAERRGRMALFLGTLQLAVLVLSVLLAAIKPSPGLLRFLASVLAGYFLLVLALVRLTPHPRAALAHGFALAALASLEGGPAAAWAALSSFVLAALFVGVDHHARLLVAFRIDPRRHGGIALRRSASAVLPVAFGLAAFLAAAPLGRGQGSGFAVRGRQDRGLDLLALRTVVLTALAGTVGVYLAGRLFARSRGGEAQPIDALEPLRGEVQRLPPEAPPHEARAHEGRRGRVVRIYLRVLGGAAQAGFARHPHETPSEFAAALGEPRGPLADVTEAFLRARYGPREPGEAEVEAVEQQAELVLAHVRQKPPRPRPAAVARAHRD